MNNKTPKRFLILIAMTFFLIGKENVAKEPLYAASKSSAALSSYSINQISSKPDQDNQISPKGRIVAAQGILRVIKFYDSNANGILDPDDQEINGWKIRIQDGVDFIRFTPVSILLNADTYTVTEFTPREQNWVATTPNSVVVTVTDGGTTTVRFGNVCLDGGGGHTREFWSSSSGQAIINDGGGAQTEVMLLGSLNLRDTNGSDFDPNNFSSLRRWMQDAGGVNMAYLLSVELAAMQLNVEAGFVNSNALVYARDLMQFMPNGLSSLGFISISNLMIAANMELGLHAFTPVDSPGQAYQESLKNVLRTANCNRSFVQSSPCPYNFCE